MDFAGTSPEANYPHLSPQLAARTRQMWSARGLDFDRVWRQTIGALRGLTVMEFDGIPGSSAPVDRLFLFDQGLIWVQSLRAAMAAGREMALGLAPAQIEGLAALAARLVEELAGLRMMALAGLTVPSLQVARSVSEDADMALVLALRRSTAQQFIACRTPEEANEFWRRHIAGGRAFRVVTERLYSVGLETEDHGEYGRWRREVLAFLGTAAHPSFLSGLPAPEAGEGASQGAGMAAEALEFATLRLQEMCAYAHVLSPVLHEDLGRILKAAPEAGPRHEVLRFAVWAGEIIVEQMRWSLRQRIEPEAGALRALH